jgi:3-isopropylmalate dehydrogenase
MNGGMSSAITGSSADERVKKIAVLPGDGIGPEVMAESLRVLDSAGERYGFSLEKREALIGGVAIDETGTPLPEKTLQLCRESDAVLLGSVGGPKWDRLPPDKRPELGGLLAIRKALKLYANLRPVKLFPALVPSCPVRLAPGASIDLLTVRELSSGIYFGQPKELSGEKGIDTMVYESSTVRKIVQVAFEAARRRKNKLTSVDKANVLSSSMLWRQVVEEMALDYPDVELDHMYVDNAAMQMILNPGRFDVIVTGNLFGDILSDESAALGGSLGMLPSASLGETVHLYEPSGGSAPDIAGKGIANPIAQILSGAMMLEYSFGMVEAARAIEAAVGKALDSGARTGDIASGEKSITTAEMADQIITALA